MCATATRLPVRDPELLQRMAAASINKVPMPQLVNLFQQLIRSAVSVENPQKDVIYASIYGPECRPAELYGSAGVPRAYAQIFEIPELGACVDRFVRESVGLNQ